MASSFKNAHAVFLQSNTDTTLYTAGSGLTAAIIHSCYIANKHVTSTLSITLKITDFSRKDGVGGVVDTTPTTGEGNLSGAWEASKSYINVAQTQVLNQNGGPSAGINCVWNIITDVTGIPTLTLGSVQGSSYAVNDVITITDPGNTSNTCSVTVSSLADAPAMTVLQQVPVPPNTTLSLDKPLNLSPNDAVIVQGTHINAEVFASVLEQS